MKYYLLFFFVLFNIHAHSQVCERTNLYGWATQNGGTTGGDGGQTVIVKTIAELNLQAGKSQNLIVLVQGTLTGSAVIKSNKTIFGLPGSKIKGRLSINSSKNVIIRNLIIRGNSCSSYDNCRGGDDAVSLNGSTNVWLDHLDIADGQDGNCDITSASDFVTVSWCKFSYTYDKEHRFSNLNGSADNATGDRNKLNITFHHNWWADRIVERQPRLRFGKMHVANNLYTSVSSNYIVGVGIEVKVLIQGNIMKTNAPPVSFFPGGLVSNVYTSNNVGPAGANQYNGTAFTPPYALRIDPPDAALENVLRNCAGAKLNDPRIPLRIEQEDDVLESCWVGPNPVIDYLQIELPAEADFDIFDIHGRLVTKPKKSNSGYDVSDLNAGIYFVRLTLRKEIKIFRIAKNSK